MITEKHIGRLLYLTAGQIRAPHCFTTRLGGVSRGYLDSLNLGGGRGDSQENVRENFHILASALGFRAEDLVLAKQVHSDTILQVTEAHRGAGLFAPGLPPCDALITNVPGLALTVFSADCTPILLWDSVTGAVGAVHAGWRGTVSGIAGKTVSAMVRAYGCRPEDLRAAIGPNIGQCHFETDADVPQALLAALGNEAEQYILRKGEKFFPDLKAINAMILRRAGVSQIEISDACTACRPDLYWSHRVTQGRRGSQGALIVCRREANP